MVRMATFRRIFVVFLFAAMSAADCSFDWRIQKGDTYRSGQSCFDSMTAGPTFTALPATAQYFRLINGDGVAFAQTTSMDLVALNTSTGEVLWDTYNASSDLSLLLKPRTRAGGTLNGPGGGQVPPYAPAQESADTGSVPRSPLHLGMEPPQQVVSGVHDPVRNLVYLEQGGALTAVVAATGPGIYVNLDHTSSPNPLRQTASLPGGHVVWSIGLDGTGATFPAWQSTSSGRSLLVPALLPASNTAQSDILLMLLEVFSIYRGVVTSSWLAAVDLNAPQVLWAAPIVPGALTRAGCLWPPLFLGPQGSPPSHVMLTCDTDRLEASTQNTTLLVYSLADGSPVWNVSLWDGSVTSPTLPPVSYSTMAWYTPAQRTSPCTATDAQCDYAVGSSQPGNPGLWIFTTSPSGDVLVQATFMPAVSLGGGDGAVPMGGPQGQLLAVPAASQIVIFTSDGSIAGLNPTSLQYSWVIPLGLPPVSSTANWGQYFISAWTYDEETSTAWMTWANMNGSSSLVGVQVCAGCEGVLVYSGWPSSLPGLAGEGPLPFADVLPVVLPPTQGEATRGVNLLVAGYARIATAIRIPVTSSGTGAVGFQWTYGTRGAVRGTPLLVTNPANASQGLLIYDGADDGFIYAVDPNSQDPSTAVWMADGSFLNVYVSGNCAGVWSKSLLVCAGSYGSLAIWSLSNGTLLAVADMRNYWANACASVPFPAYTSGIVLLDDDVSESGLSLLLLMGAMIPNQSVNALIRLPVGAVTEVLTDVDDDDGAPIPWWTFYPASPGAAVPASRRVDIAWQTTAASPNYGRPFAVSGFTTEGTLFVPLTYKSVLSQSMRNGSVLWSSTAAYPQDGLSWYITALAYAPVSDIVVAALMDPAYHEDESKGLVSAVRGSDGGFLWVTPRLCIPTRGGVTIEPWHSASGTGESLVYLSCSNAGPAGLQGKIVLLSAATGAIVGYAGRPDGAMVGDVTLVPSLPSLPTTGATAAPSNVTGPTLALVYGAAGGLVAAYNVSELGLTDTAPGQGRALQPSATDDDADDSNDDQPDSSGVLRVLGRTRLPGSATAVEWTYLNFYPSFTFSFLSDVNGVLYGAGGDDRNAYIVRLPGLICPCAGSTTGVQSVQCCSGGRAPVLPSASASAQPAPAQPGPAGVGPTAIAVGVGSTIGALVVAMAAALLWRRQRASKPPTLGRPSRAVSDARVVMLQGKGSEEEEHGMRAALLEGPA